MRERAHTTTIMVVDDVPENLHLLRDILHSEGYRVLAFPNGPMALKAASKNPPDLILLDIMMPGMDGFEVARHLKGEEKLRNIPILFLSALKELEDKVMAFAVGAVDYISKPFHVEEVLARVKAHAELQRQRHELAEAYEKLKKSEAYLSATLKSLAEGVITCDVKAKIMSLNPTAAFLTGCSEEHAMGRPIEEVLRFTNIRPFHGVEDLLHRARVEGRATIPEEALLVSHNGKTHPVAGSCALIREASGQSYGFVWVFWDILERKRAEEEVRKLAQAVKQSPASIVITDTKGTIEYVNPKFTEVTGYTFEEALGQNPRILKSGKQPKSVYEELWKTITSGGEWRGEFHNRKKNGELYWEYASISPIKNERGEITHYIAVKEDITERKRMEQELMEANRRLETAMARANEMAQQAEQASRAKGIFLANMSHEIRTPLNAVIGMTGLLLETELTDEQRRYAKIIYSSSEALLDLLNDILDYSKIEAGKLELEHLPFDLGELLDEILDAFAIKATEKQLELMAAIDPDVPLQLRGDRGRLRQILTNLVGNAIKFTHKGEVCLWVTVSSVDEDSVLLLFRVRDTGIGIPADKISMVFEKFTQVDTSVTRHYGGTGLGLAISKHLAELMGGEIGVESVEGKGSEFWFTARFTKHQGVFEPKLALPVDVSSVRVLIVDDNATNRDILIARLSSWGMRAEAVADGPAALDLLSRALDEEDPFTVAIIDFQMPGMDGLSLGKTIQTDPRLRELRMILATSMGDNLGPACAEAGFSLCLSKPIRHHELLKTLARALSGESLARDVSVLRKTVIQELPDLSYCKKKILLVEDNPVNQQVAMGILNKMRLSVDVAGNGREALEALTNRHYDLVLMDVQMPEMDGLEATRRIRRGEAGPSHIPIIAMTAHAMQGDREMCLKAGVNDYVSKPITPKALAAVLQKWLFKHPEHQNQIHTWQGDTLQSREDVTAVWDRQGLLARLMGDEALAMKILEAFLDEAPRQLETLKGYLNASETERAHRQAHSLKGAALNVGAEKMAAIASAMEQAGKLGDPLTMVAHLEELVRAFEEFSEMVRGKLL